MLQFNHFFSSNGFIQVSQVWAKNLKVGLVSFIISIVCLNASASLAQAQAKEYEESVKSNVPVVLVHGDSLSAGYGVPAKQGWVALLNNTLANINVINSSISGETTSGGKQRLPQLLEKYQPAVLVLQLGANDALRGQNLRATQQNLAYMIEQCTQYNPQCQVVLLGIKLPTNYGPAYEQMLQSMYANLAEKYGLIFDPFFIEEVALKADLMQDDGLHPNQAAQPKIKQRVAPLIKQALEQAAPGQN